MRVNLQISGESPEGKHQSLRGKSPGQGNSLCEERVKYTRRQPWGCGGQSNVGVCRGQGA